MYQAFRTMKKENLTYIVRSLEDEFAKSETLTDHKQQVAAFSRKPGEPIRSCLSRFRRILEKTQTRMSTSRAKERTISKLEQLLFTVASPSALIKLKEAERNSEANGYELSWTTMLKIVEEQEDIAQDVPQEAKPLSIHVHEVTTRPRGPSPKTHNMSTGRLRTQSRSPSPAGRYSTAAEEHMQVIRIALLNGILLTRFERKDRVLMIILKSQRAHQVLHHRTWK
ncbi:unnamed protein product [Sphagnum tenellum]